MKVNLSTWKQVWTNVSLTIQERVHQALKANAEICIKGTNATRLYGPETWGIFKTWPWKGKSNDDLERLCKTYGVKVQLWDFPYFQWPQGSADAVNESINRWNPTDVWLDAEGRYIKDWPGNTGPFLRGLGVVTVKFWLQSYRRPDYHPQVNWRKWLTYKDPQGKYIIHGLGPQAYPIGSKNWPADFERMVDEYEKILAPIGRLEMPWYPTLPTFTERGWTPQVEDMIAGIDYLVQRLGSRLVGFNFWRQEFLFNDNYAPILDYIGTLATPDPGPEPRDDWFKQMHNVANGHGWDITAELPPEV